MIRNRVIEYALLFIAAYFLAAHFIKPLIFVEILNGLFLGWFASSLLVYGHQVWMIIWKQGRYSARSQFMLGLSAFVLSMALVRTSSVIFRSMSPGNMWILSTHLSDFAEYLAILGGTLMTTTPGFADKELGRKDRKTLLVCFLVGLVVAAVTIYIQRANLLAMISISLANGLGAP